MAKAPKNNDHRWSFYRAGGVDQVRLDEGADVFHLDQLDQKLWVALSCPTKGLEIDQRMLELIDADADGHVRPPEVLATVKWLRDVLQNGDALAEGVDGVDLTNVRKDTDDGKAVLASALHMLESIGKKAKAITVADTEAALAAFAKATRNGDGVVVPGQIEDTKLQQLAADIVACMGGVTDRSGEQGVDQATLDAFFAACADNDAWYKAAEGDKAKVLPFGDDTGSAHAAFGAVKAKIDDYFGRCRLAAFDPRALAVVNRDQDAYVAAAQKDLSISAGEVAHFPLAIVEPQKPLPLSKGVNPAWAAALATFRKACCGGKDTLAEADWEALCAKFAGYEAWQAARAGAAVDGLGKARVREILASNGKANMQAAIDADLAVATQVEAMTKVEKLARLHREFAKLLNNYVAFTDFYARRGAIFQAGTLYLDGRACEMCFHVDDAGKHAKMAPMSNAFLAYVDCRRPGGEKMSVACAVTAGDSDNLFEGRNGIFYDRKGNDWDATITKIVSNPISIGQAFWSPYKKALRGIQEMIAKRAAAADEAANQKLATGVAAADEATKSGKGPDKPKFEVGTIAALGVAVSGIAGVFTALLTGFLDLGPWIPLGILGLMLAISGPSMFIAWLKLRTRNLGPILDANGWAVNTLTRVNLPLGGSLTETPKIPSGAHRSLVDPYAPKKPIWPRILMVLVLLGLVTYGLYRFNFLHRWLPDYVPEYVSSSFDGPDEAFAGSENVVIRLGSGATSVAVSGLDGIASLDVNAAQKAVTVPLANAKADTVITLTDASKSRPQVHTIRIVAKPAGN